MAYQYLGFIALVVAVSVSRSTARGAFLLLSKEQHAHLVTAYKPWRTMLLCVVLSLLLIFYNKPLVFVTLSILMLVFYQFALARKFNVDGFPKEFRQRYLFSKIIFYIGVGVCLASVAVANKMV